MNKLLYEHIDKLFEGAPDTKQTNEIKEEILQNTLDRYNDLISEGKTEEEAYRIAVAGIGDITHLIESVAVPDTNAGYTREQIEKNRKSRSILLSVAVALYIMCIIPPIIFEETYENLGVVLMFVIAAIATGIIIYRAGTKLNYSEEAYQSTEPENCKTKAEKSILRAINGVICAIMLIVYFAVSFLTGAWYITWVIFLIGTAVMNIVKAIFDLTR